MTWKKRFRRSKDGVKQDVPERLKQLKRASSQIPSVAAVVAVDLRLKQLEQL